MIDPSGLACDCQQRNAAAAFGGATAGFIGTLVASGGNILAAIGGGIVGGLVGSAAQLGSQALGNTGSAVAGSAAEGATERARGRSGAKGAFGFLANAGLTFFGIEAGLGPVESSTLAGGIVGGVGGAITGFVASGGNPGGVILGAIGGAVGGAALGFISSGAEQIALEFCK